MMSAHAKLEGQHLIHFRHATQVEVRDVKMKSPSKFSELDPLLTNLLKTVPNLDK